MMLRSALRSRLLSRSKTEVKWNLILFNQRLLTKSLWSGIFHKRFINTRHSSSTTPIFKRRKRLSKFEVFNYYDEAEKLLHNDSLKARLLQTIQTSSLTSEQVVDIDNIFSSLLDMISSNQDTDALYLAANIWEEVLLNNPDNASLENLQQLLLSKRTIFVHILINQKYYKPYKTLMSPLFEKNHIKVQWCDVMADTIQFEESRQGQIIFNDKRIIQFLENKQTPISQKRLLLANFLRKGLLGSKSGERDILLHFFKYLELFEDRHCLLDGAEHSAYTSPLLLLVDDHYGTKVPISTIEEIFEELFLNKKFFYNFLTTLLKVTHQRSPSETCMVWDFKLSRHNRNGDVLAYKDLTYMLSALSNLKKYNEAFELSESFPELYHEDQLSVLLKNSERLKNWSMLKSQFEAMYGKGHLPYAIHYSIVMDALANLGAKSDVDRLFNQLKQRKLQPTPSLYASMIKVRVLQNEFDEAKEIFSRFLADDAITKDQDMTTAQVYSLLFDIHLASIDKQDVLDFLHQTIEIQRAKNLQLLDWKTMCKVIKYFERCYGFKEILQIKSICEEFDLMNEEIYCSLIHAFTRFEKFKMAETLVYEAHHISRLPLKNSMILREQLRNYREWYTKSDSISKKRYIAMKTDIITERVRDNEVTPKGIQILYSEVIEFYLSRNQLGLARKYFERLSKEGIVTERVYLPFLRHYSKSQRTSDHELGLALYREMVGNNVNISIQTYVHIMRSVVFLDKQNQNDYGTCDRLIESIFEMCGLTIPNKPSFNTSTNNKDINIRKDAIYICQIVSTYIINKPSSQIEKADFVVEFLTQLRTKLDHQMEILLRMTIYREMGRLYKRLNNLQMAKSLILNGLNEMDDLVNNYIDNYPLPYDYKFEIPIPGSLESTYRSLLEMHFEILTQTRSSAIDYLNLYQKCENQNIKLNGTTYNHIISQLITLEGFKGLEPILSIIEEHLADGNYNELGLMKRFKYLYNLFLLERSKRVLESSLLLTYKIYNDFYNVQNISQLKRDMPSNIDIRSTMENTLTDLLRRYPRFGNWDLDYVFDKPEIFFSPEKRLSTVNKLFPNVCDNLYHYIMKYCDGNSERLFKYMDQYPNALELILLNQSGKLRLKIFRSQISKIIEPPSDSFEDFDKRRIRTLKALHKLFRPLHQTA